MMIDIDEELTLANASAHRAQAFKAGGVGRDDTIKDHSRSGFLKGVVRVQELIFLRHRVLIPAVNGFAFVAQSHRQAELRADTITIGTDVPGNAKGSTIQNALDD